MLTHRHVVNMFADLDTIDPEEASGTRVEGMNWVTIDAGQKPEEVQNEIRKEVDSLLSKRTPKSLQRLWVSHTDPSQHF